MSPAPELSVGIIHPAPLVRFALCEALRTRVRQVVAGGDLDELLTTAGTLHLLICELITPTRTAPMLIRQVRERIPGCRILFLSNLDDVAVIGSLLATGADGYVLNTESLDHVLHAISCVAAGQRYLPPEIPGIERASAQAQEILERFDRLTTREREVFALLIGGHSNSEIAARLFISVRTAEQHHRRINEKLGPASVSNAIRHGAVYQLLEVMRLPRPSL